MLYRYIDILDILIEHICRKNEHKRLLHIVKEMFLCFDPCKWARLNPAQRKNWVRSNIPQDLKIS